MEQVKQDVLVVIPARLESKRFPGKPLIEVAGKPLIWYAWHVASTWPRANGVVIASPDASILDAMARFGAEVQHSPPELRNGSQRAFDVWHHMGSSFVVDLQCDEPEVTHAMLDAAVSPWCDGDPDIATLSGPFFSGHPSTDPNEVKVVVSQLGRAVYFSRQPLPASRRHIGIYAFRGYNVSLIASETESVCGRAERLEQLDWLDAGWPIQVVPVEATPLSINTPRDMEIFTAKVEGRG